MEPDRAAEDALGYPSGLGRRRREYERSGRAARSSRVRPVVNGAGRIGEIVGRNGVDRSRATNRNPEAGPADTERAVLRRVDLGDVKQTRPAYYTSPGPRRRVACASHPRTSPPAPSSGSSAASRGERRRRLLVTDERTAQGPVMRPSSSTRARVRPGRGRDASSPSGPDIGTTWSPRYVRGTTLRRRHEHRSTSARCGRSAGKPPIPSTGGRAPKRPTGAHRRRPHTRSRSRFRSSDGRRDRTALTRPAPVHCRLAMYVL